jgi:TonB-dependent receptor
VKRSSSILFPGKFAIVLMFLLPLLCWSDQVTVRAIDQLTGQGIGEASLSLSSIGRREAADAAGWIQIQEIEAGIYDGMISAPGYAGRHLRIEVRPGGPSHKMEVFLSPIVHELAEFEVTTELDDRDRDAIAERGSITPMNQISGDELKDVTDEHLGDTLEKIAGVTVSSEDGNVSGINIRGAGPKQTRVTLDGQSLAGGGGRGTTRGAGAMGRIPREFLDRVQVMKAPTPDMDADAIGGTVDLQTSRVARSKKARSTMSYRGGFQEAGETYSHRFNLARAQPISLGKDDQRMGILIALNAEDGDNNGDEIRVLNQWPLRNSPDTGERVRTLARLRAGKRINHNKGYGLVLNTDLQLNRNHHFQLKGMWNSRTQSQSSQFNTVEFIRGKIISLEPGKGRFENIVLEKQFFERLQENASGSIVLAAEHKFGDWRLDESIGFSIATNDSDGATNALFRTGKVFDGSYDVTSSTSLPRIELSSDGQVLNAEDLADPEPYEFFRYDLIDDWAEDKETALRANLERKWKTEKTEWLFKGGIKARLRDAVNDQDKLKFNANEGFQLTEVYAPGEPTVFRGNYPSGPSWSAAAMQDRFLEHADDFLYDPNDALLDSFGSDFSVSESIYATYGMIQRESEKWIFITGLRLERTESETRGYETVTMKDDSGERLVEVNSVSISDTYDKLFPGLHFLYRPTPKLILRASATRTLQRPDFRDLSPSMRVNLDNKWIRSGNPDLEPFDAKAVDVGADFVLNGWGSVSLGLFYKRIDDFIVDIKEETEYLGEPGFTRSHPINGSPADLLGLEVAWSSQLAFLPGALEETSLSVNYTLTDSTAAYPGHEGEIIMLPDQIRQSLNLSLRWKHGNWTISLRTRYRGLQLKDLTEPGQDQFNAGFWSHSASIGYKLNDTLSFSLGMANLNRPDRSSYQGIPSQPVATREGSRSVNIGLNLKFGGSKG